MSRDAVEQMVGRAVIDRAFCSLLLASPADAAREYDLSEFERRLFARLRAGSLEELAQLLEQRLDQLPLGRPERRPRETPMARARRATA